MSTTAIWQSPLEMQKSRQQSIRLSSLESKSNGPAFKRRSQNWLSISVAVHFVHLLLDVCATWTRSFAFPLPSVLQDSHRASTTALYRVWNNSCKELGTQIATSAAANAVILRVNARSLDRQRSKLHLRRFTLIQAALAVG